MDLCASDVPKSTLSSNPRAACGCPELSLLPTKSNRNDPGAGLPSVLQQQSLCVHELLQDGIRRNPEAIAIEFQARSLTYDELDRRSNQLARLLRKQGVEPEVLVGVCVDRSIEMVIALLGILKAGGAYVPLDPTYPSDRIQYVLDDARVNILITQRDLRSSLPVMAAELICIDSDASRFEREDTVAVESGVRPENLAYVIYTSGSTGRPKGVQVEHRSVVNFLSSMQRQPGMSADDALVAVTTLAFDIAGLEIYLPLLVGGRLVIAPRDTIADGRSLMELLTRSHATTMQATPTTWRLLLESGWKGNDNLKVLVGGDALSADLARQLAQRCGSVWNMYGPTETTIWSSVYRVMGNDEKLVPIGKPIDNTTFRVFDANRQPVAEGAEGELYIGGAGLARGYFDRAELTREKFVADPFSPVPGARLYRTGDLVRLRPDGDIEFLGRIDHQVKIRGFRVELGEIEAVLEQHTCVRQAVVIAREDAPGDKRLVAYYVSKPGKSVSLSLLREHLAQQLPEYMLPVAFVQIENFPLTPNGKVDRKALPAPKGGDFGIRCQYLAPRDATERTLVNIWEKVLGVSPISVRANFFELGGHSLLAGRLFTKILHTFGKELPLSTLFRSPTVESLAKELEVANRIGEYQTLVPIQAQGTELPFFCVHGGAGSTLFLKQLSCELGVKRPFYGIEPEGLDGNRICRLTVEEMAAHYVAEIRKVQPSGPYYLGGYCFGGLAAFEMARILQQQGESVALVALFSAALRGDQPKSQSVSPMSESVATRGLRALASPVRAIRSLCHWLYWRADDIIRPLSYRITFALGMRIPARMRAIYVLETLGQIERRYRPKFYHGTVVLFYGSGNVEFGPNLGWDGLAASFEHCVIGDGALDSRRDIMNDPLVAITAAKLAPYLSGEAGASPPEMTLRVN
jgi:amino acid adenylation domain-containing protein